MAPWVRLGLIESEDLRSVADINMCRRNLTLTSRFPTSAYFMPWNAHVSYKYINVITFTKSSQEL